MVFGKWSTTGDRLKIEGALVSEEFLKKRYFGEYAILRAMTYYPAVISYTISLTMLPTNFGFEMLCRSSGKQDFRQNRCR